MRFLGSVNDDKDIATAEYTRKSIKATVPSSGWVVSTTKTGYYENVVSIANGGGNPIWGIAGATDDAFPTDDEKSAYEATEYMYATSAALIFYATEKPTTTFYVIVRE